MGKEIKNDYRIKILSELDNSEINKSLIKNVYNVSQKQLNTLGQKSIFKKPNTVNEVFKLFKFEKMIDFKSFIEIKDLIDTNKINAIELVNDVTNKLETVGRSLNAVRFVFKEFAIERAKKLLEKQEQEYPLNCIPLAHKELFQRLQKME